MQDLVLWSHHILNRCQCSVTGTSSHQAGVDMLVFKPYEAEGIVHEFLPLNTYPCTVAIATVKANILTAPCLFHRIKGFREGKIPVFNCKCCHHAPTTYTWRVSQISQLISMNFSTLSVHNLQDSPLLLYLHAL